MTMPMTKSSRRQLIVAVSAFVAMWLYPPWLRTDVVYNPQYSVHHPDTPVGYSCIFAPGHPSDCSGSYDDSNRLAALGNLLRGGPYTRYAFGSNRVYWLDWERLCLQWLVLIMMVAGAAIITRILAMRSRRAKQLFFHGYRGRSPEEQATREDPRNQG